MRWKRITALAAVAALLLCSGCNFRGLIGETAYSDTASFPSAPTEAAFTLPAAEEPATLKAYDFSRLKYSGNAAALACFDVRGNRYLHERNTVSRISPASLLKIVTASVALKYGDISAVCTVGPEIGFARPNSSLCYIDEGYQATLYDLLCGMLLASGNDAAYTVAVNVARAVAGASLNDTEAVAYFVGLMNGYAAEIGLTDSRFVNPDGWDDPGQYMTLRDIVTAALAALQNDVFRDIVGKDYYSVRIVSGQTLSWSNGNLLLDPDTPYYQEGVRGIKTGTTGSAGKCVIAVYEDADHELIVASMGNKTDADRYFSVREMIDTVRSQ